MSVASKSKSSQLTGFISVGAWWLEGRAAVAVVAYSSGNVRIGGPAKLVGAKLCPPTTCIGDDGSSISRSSSSVSASAGEYAGKPKKRLLPWDPPPAWSEAWLFVSVSETASGTLGCWLLPSSEKLTSSSKSVEALTVVLFWLPRLTMRRVKSAAERGGDTSAASPASSSSSSSSAGGSFACAC